MLLGAVIAGAMLLGAVAGAMEIDSAISTGILLEVDANNSLLLGAVAGAMEIDLAILSGVL